jgi:RimJ/RimL family protein N-acetyltransferase
MCAIVSYVLPGNHASRRVVEKAGFACEGPFTHARRQHLLYRLKASTWSTASQPRERLHAEAMLQTA